MNTQSILLTDLYQLTMLQGYYSAGMYGEAVFEFFVRDQERRNFLLAAGLEQVLDFLEQAAFTDGELQWLHQSGLFPRDFSESLADWRFTGDVDAMREGTIFFPDEPILRVTAPIGQAQLVETRIVSLLHLHTLLASKAVRCVLAAPDKLLVDFGLRRAHGFEAGLTAARASYLAGFAGTSTVLAGELYGIPVYGTMAHSYIQAHDDEHSAFLSFARARPQNVTLLIDTYDTEAGAKKVVEVSERLAKEGITVRAVRLDSGDLGEHARKVRKILDEGGLAKVRIFASGNLDEYRIGELSAQGAPIDGYGVGTRMDTSEDRPYLDCAYKLTEYKGVPRLKLSEGKRTWPGRKQVYRRYDARGRIHEDELTLVDEPAEGEPLLVKVMENGRRIREAESLDVIRDRTKEQLKRLPEAMRTLDEGPPYQVKVSQPLRTMAEELQAALEHGMSPERG